MLRKIRAADGAPGVLDDVLGERLYLHDAHPEGGYRGPPGEIIAQRDGAILRATVDGAVWITHLRRVAADEPTFKLPAAMVLGDRLSGVPEFPLAPQAVVAGDTWREIRYEEHEGVGYLHFPFLNGAMGTEQCERLLEAYRHARSRPTRVIALMGGPDFWSNGIDLNLIEASAHPADESWNNINAMNDLVHEIVVTDRQLTVAAMQGNAGAGGVFLALAADRVWARSGVVLNPHYKSMGNLYGSEYWTYLLPRRVSPDNARAITQSRLPVGAHAAAAIGLIDDHFGTTPEAFRAEACRPSAKDRRRSGAFRDAKREEGSPPGRRGGKAPRRLPGGGARADAAQFLRIRLQLPRGPVQFRRQGAALAHAALARAPSRGGAAPRGGLKATWAAAPRHRCCATSTPAPVRYGTIELACHRRQAQRLPERNAGPSTRS